MLCKKQALRQCKVFLWTLLGGDIGWSFDGLNVKK
jgi:hypothetical protein